MRASYLRNIASACITGALVGAMGAAGAGRWCFLAIPATWAVYVLGSLNGEAMVKRVWHIGGRE